MTLGKPLYGSWLIALAIALSACSSVRPDFFKQPSKALPPATDTPTTRYVEAETDAHPGESGMRLLTLNANALMSRIALADHARHSIDVQYYIFHNDATGRLMAQRLLAAADRGVRVRILLDDINIAGKDRELAALDAHPHIEVRLFNPFYTRSGSLLLQGFQFLLDGRRLNRRMHNKSFIVDNQIAIIGGRNIGDEYFSAGDAINFRDLDVTMIGPVVAATSRSFDAYWNSKAAYPVAAFRTTHADARDLDRLRRTLKIDARAFAKSDYAQNLFNELPNGASGARSGEWFWGPAELLADQPEKVDVERDRLSFRIGPQLKEILDAAQSELLLISPYFIPGDSGTQFLAGLVRDGVSVKVLTNSLASNDEAVVHSGYAKYRRALLEAGVDLWELRPSEGGESQTTTFGKSSGVSLHAKAMVVDRRLTFIGSLNIDPRSALLNTEMGVIVDSPALAAAVVDYFDKVTSPENSYHVILSPPDAGSGGPTASRSQSSGAMSSRRIIWVTEKNGRNVRYTHEPDVSAWKRLQSRLFGLLPIEGLL
ncbi:MAG TPA: phospholipase D family protein [Rhodanobacteraceae bacterium]|nr:phospholipase D family protein [Rhodanobacteraceae bacterium]